MEHLTNKDDDFRYETEFANSLIELDIYRLLTILFSSKALHQADPPIFGLEMMAWRFERAEIHRIVFTVAIRTRNILDNTSSGSKKIGDQTTGILEYAKETCDLSLREACNKIIHSEHINFGIIGFESPDLHKGVTEFIYVYGKKGKSEWKATINLIKFSDAVMQIGI